MPRTTRNPEQYACLIKCCSLPHCAEWFIGTPRQRYCPPHRVTQAGMLREFARPKGKDSRFSREEILEMREMFHRMPAREIAEHFDCKVSLIYRYQKRDPVNYRRV